MIFLVDHNDFHRQYSHLLHLHRKEVDSLDLVAERLFVPVTKQMVDVLSLLILAMVIALMMIVD